MHTCPLETMTGSCMSSRDIGHLNSSGMIGDLWFMEAKLAPNLSGAGGSVMTQSLSFLSKDDISSTHPSGSPPLEMTISCKATDSFLISAIVCSCSFSEILVKTRGSKVLSARADDISFESCASGGSVLAAALLNWECTSATWIHTVRVGVFSEAGHDEGRNEELVSKEHLPAPALLQACRRCGRARRPGPAESGCWRLRSGRVGHPLASPGRSCCRRKLSGGGRARPRVRRREARRPGAGPAGGGARGGGCGARGHRRGGAWARAAPGARRSQPPHAPAWPPPPQPWCGLGNGLAAVREPNKSTSDRDPIRCS